MKRKLLSILLALSLALSLLPTMALADGDETPVAKIGDTGYETLKAAFESDAAKNAASDSPVTIEIIEAGEYDIPGSFDNITLKGNVTEGEVVAILKSNLVYGQTAGKLNNVTFEKLTFKFSNNNYTGFQHSGAITFNDCILNGKFNTYSPMTFIDCTFNAPGTEASGFQDADYSMWCYGGGDCIFTNCTFNGAGKFLNVYNEGNDGGTPWNVTATGCTFNSTKTNKAAFNVKETCGDKALRYNVSISNCTCNENFPAASESDTLIVFNGLVQVDDRKADNTGITVTLDGTKVYENGKKVSTNFFEKEGAWHIANLAGLKEFAEAANGGNTLKGKTVVLDADIDLDNEEWTPIRVPELHLNITFDGNGNTISNVKVSGNEKNVGLFGDFSCCTIKNLTVNGANVTGINHVAALCGHGVCTKIEGCTVKNAVVTTNVYNNDDGDKAGAICGYLSGESEAWVKNCTVENCTITGYRDIGGAVGYANGGAIVSDTTVKNTTVINDQRINYKNYATDDEFDAGEIVGEAVTTAKVESCTADEDVKIERRKLTVVVNTGDGDDSGDKTVEVKTKVEVNVDTTKAEAVFGDEGTAAAAATKVTGVELTIEPQTTEQGKEEKSGLQAVIDAAKDAAKEDKTKTETLANAETVKVEVTVNVIPQSKTDNQVKVKLEPVAKVTVDNTTIADNIPVTNDMINTDNDIRVTAYIGFEPKQLIHTGDDGEVIDVFGAGQFDYDGTKKTATVTIHHFSDLTGLKEENEAMVTLAGGTVEYATKFDGTFMDTIDGGGKYEGCTVTLLKDISIQVNTGSSNGAVYCIDTAPNNHFTIDGNGKTITALVGTNKNGYLFNVREDVTFKNLKIRRGNDATGSVYMRGGVNVAQDVTVTIINCDIDTTSKNSDEWNTPIVAGADSTVIVNGGSYVGGCPGDYRGVNIDGNKSFTFVSGTTNGIFTEDTVNYEIQGGYHHTRGVAKKDGSTNTGKGITGGYFANDVSAYCAEDYECVENPDTETKDTYKYVVQPMAPVAKIGEKTYTTLAKAIAAVPTDGTKTKITLLSDITAAFDKNVTTAYVTIDGGRNVDLDMNGHTIAISAYNAGPFAIDGGRLELSGTGKVENTYEEGFYVVELYSAPTAQANYSVFTQGENVTLTGDWAVVNIQATDADNNASNYGAVVNLNGTCNTDDTDDYVVYVSGNVHNTKNAAIINFGSTSKIEAGNYIAGYAVVNVADGAEFTSEENCISIAAGELNISGGTFTGGDDVEIVGGSGGSIDFETCCAVLVKQHTTNLPITVNIKDGTFKSAFPFYQATGQAETPKPEDVKLNISGGKFFSTYNGGEKAAVKSDDKTGFITGGLYSGKVDAAYVASGYVCVSNADTATKAEYPYIVKAAEVEVAEEATTVNKDGDKADTIADVINDELATEAKKDEAEKIVKNAEETYASNIQQQITEEKVKVKDNENSGQTKEVTLGESTKTRIDVKLESLQVDIGTNAETPAMVTDCTVTTQTATYDVKPVVTVTTTNEQTGKTTVETLVITNEWLKENNKVLTFTLPVPDSMTGNSVLVTHIKESGDTETFNARVETDENGNRFITIAATEFSIYELSQQTEEDAIAKIENGGKIYYYSSLANAVSDAQDGDTIILLTNSETGTITVDREVSFTLKLNGKALKANIVAGEDYTLSRSGNTYTVTEYVAPTYSGGGATAYAVTAESAKNGKLTVDKKNASAGSTVTITVVPDKGFTLETLTVLDKNGKEIEVKNLGNNKYSFKMPSGKVTVEATFMEDNTMLNFFVDVPATEYYYDAVLWAAENSITTGVDAVHFGPEAPVTRGQVVTFLWRAAGSPEPKGDADKFTDLLADQYYLKAVAWAIEQGITKGVTDTTFEPETVCTRGQIVTFLARFAGVEDTETESVFADVPASEFFAAAVKWAKDNGVTSGVTETTFEPYTNCNRAQVVTFLYRWMVK